jgi:hypothetical protein
VRVAFWIFLVGSVLLTALTISMGFDTDPADGVSIGVIILVWLFDLGVCVLPTFLIGRRLHRCKKASRRGAPAQTPSLRPITRPPRS